MAEFRFDEETHRYFLEDRELPSVTRSTNGGLTSGTLMSRSTISRKSCGTWCAAKPIPTCTILTTTRHKQKRCQKRSHVMRLISEKKYTNGSRIFCGINPRQIEQVKRACDGFLRWWHESPGGVPEVIAVEEPVYHPTYLYAGTPDFIIRRDKFLYVVDIKTGNAFREPELLMQLAAYAEAWDIMCADYETKWIEGCIGVRLDKKTGLVYERNYTDVYEDGVPFSMFLHLLEFYNEAHAK